MRFSDIPQFPKAHAEHDVSLRDLVEHMDHWMNPDKFGLDMAPDFQRGHVWTEAQQIAFVEHILKGGEVGKTVIVNVPGYRAGTYTSSAIVDGKQRLTALLRFVQNEIPVFGLFRREFTGNIPHSMGIKWRIVDLKRIGILRLYLALNAGGTPHRPEEINRVQHLLEEAEKAGEE